MIFLQIIKNIYFSFQNPERPIVDTDPIVNTKLSRNASQKSMLQRDITARQKSDEYRIHFRLPKSEILDGNIKASLWTPYAKKHVHGVIYVSQNYLCFRSDIDGLVSLVIPLSNIVVSIKM